MSKSLLPLKDFDKLFHSDQDAKVVPCGVETRINEKQAEEFMRTLFKEGDESIEFIASCECGSRTGNYYIGSTCSECQTNVLSPFTGELKFKAWLEIPDYIPPILQPAAYRTLKKWLGTMNGVPLLDAILDINTEFDEDLETNVGRGFKNFYNNFDKIMNYLLYEYRPFQRANMKGRAKEIPEYLKLYRKVLFIRHIPILNENLHILNRSGSLSFTDISSSHIMKTVVELSHLAYAYSTMSRPDEYLEQNMFVMYQSYITYIDSIIKDKITEKKGFIRKCILGSKVHFSFRGVIVPITASKYADEIELPWKIGVIGNKLEIINLLTNRYGYSLSLSIMKFNKALFVYDKEIDDILKTLIAECPYKGLCVSFGRNPTMNHGSLQVLFCTKIKTSLADDTIGFSPLIIAAPN